MIQTTGFAFSEKKDSVVVETEPIIKKHDPSKATMYSAVLPGLGQIYNKRAWKVPFIYGGFAGLIYTVNYYNSRYLASRKAYFDITDNNPDTKSYISSFPRTDDPDYTQTENYSQYKNSFIKYIDGYRKNRDTFVLVTAAFYLLNVLDANVNAHLIDFDISEDLTFNIEPFIIEPVMNTPVLGGQITLTF